MEIENDEIKTNTVTYVDYLNKKIYEVQVRYSLFHRKLDAGQIAKGNVTHWTIDGIFQEITVINYN